MPQTRAALERALEDAARGAPESFEAAWAQPRGYDPDSFEAFLHQKALHERDTAIVRLLETGASHEEVARAAGLTPEGIRRLCEGHTERRAPR